MRMPAASSPLSLLANSHHSWPLPGFPLAAAQAGYKKPQTVSGPAFLVLPVFPSGCRACFPVPFPLAMEILCHE